VANDQVTLEQLATFLEVVNREIGPKYAPLGSGGFLGMIAQYCRKAAGPAGTSQVAKQAVAGLREINPGRVTTQTIRKLAQMRDIANPAEGLAQLADALIRDQADPRTAEDESRRNAEREREALIRELKAKRRKNAGRTGVLYTLKAGKLHWELQLGNRFERWLPVDEATLEEAVAERERRQQVPA
jgi:hypothetical protein